MGVFTTVENQKIICVSGKEKTDTENIYAKVNKYAMFEAIKSLTPVNFEVWLYLASQQNNYTFAFSPKAVAAESGIKKSSLQEGIRVLIEHNYLIPRKEGSNIYDFYELPYNEEEQKEEINIQIHKADNYNSGFVF